MYFAGPASLVLRASQRGLTIAELGGRVLEGWRVSETPGALAYDFRAAIFVETNNAILGVDRPNTRLFYGSFDLVGIYPKTPAVAIPAVGYVNIPAPDQGVGSRVRTVGCRVG